MARWGGGAIIRQSVYIFLAIMAQPMVAMGAFSNHNSILIGEEAAGMGGAYTALHGDVSAAPFYNPAGLAWEEGNSFSSSVSIYKKFDTIMGRHEDIIKAPLRISQGYFQSIPSSSGSVIKFGDLFVGLSVTVPDYNVFKGVINSSNNNDSLLTYIDESLWVGGVVAKKISSKETLGLTLYYTARNFNRTVQDRTVDTSTDVANLFLEEKNVVGNSLVAILGYQWHWSDQLFLGASLRLPGLELSGSGSYFKTEIQSSTGNVDLITASHPDEKSHTKIPGRLTLGGALIDGPWTWSADGSLYLQEPFYDYEDSDIRSRVNHRSMFNGAIGVSYKYSPALILRSGWYTNLSSHENLQLSDIDGEKVDQLGWAANLTFVTREKINFTFGGYYTGGIGKTIQRMNQSYQIIPETQQVFTMLLGTSFSF